MVSEYFEPKRNEQARSKATSAAELQQIEAKDYKSAKQVSLK